MKNTFLDIVSFLRNPVLEKDENTNLNYRFKVFGQILILCVIAATLTTPLFSIFESLGIISMENHKVEEAFKDLSPAIVILIGALIVPVIEELIFRAPLTAFKKPNAFKLGFYIFTIGFALIHITNFELTTSILLLSPILVLPQLFVGIGLGYLRIRFGLQWSILLHCVYNLIFLSISLLFDK